MKASCRRSRRSRRNTRRSSPTSPSTSTSCSAPPRSPRPSPTRSSTSSSASPAPDPMSEPPEKRPPSLCLVVPCKDEAPVLEETTRQLEAVIERLVARGLVAEATILYVDDGSTDETWALVERLAARSPYVEGLKLSRNFGHQNALYAGLMHTRADVAVSLDADLQDDVTVVETMLEAHREGYEVVYGARRCRRVDSLGKSLPARIYYKLLHLMGAEVVDDHADFRLLGRRALDALAEFREVHLFLRGLVPLLGFKSKIVYYERQARFAGETKYGPRKMIS